MATLLLDRGADPNTARIDDGSTPLSRASYTQGTSSWPRCCWTGRRPQHGEDRHQKYPLHVASYKGHLDVAQLLASSGTDVAAKTNRGTTAHARAVATGHADVAAFLAAVAAWPAFKVAAACRLVDAARSALWLGRMGSSSSAPAPPTSSGPGPQAPACARRSW